MSTDTTRREQIAVSLRDKTYRDAFVASLITIGLPSQIREMRLRRELSQEELGARVGMRQALISRFERKGYEAFTLKTLRKLASAFDVALKVRFVPFCEAVDDAAYPGRTPLDVASFEEDLRLIEPDGETVIAFPVSSTTYSSVISDQASATETEQISAYSETAYEDISHG